MLVIRPQQMRVLEKVQRDHFIRLVSAHVRACYQELPEGEPALRSLIEHAIARADRYEIRQADDVRRYVECCLRFGQDFDQSPSTAWAANILNTRAFDGTTKMDQIDAYELFVLKGRPGVALGDTTIETPAEPAGDLGGG